MGAGLAVPTIRYSGEQLLENSAYRTTLIRVNMEDFQCSIPSNILRVNEKNIDKFPEAYEDKETFLKKLAIGAEIDKHSMLIEMEASGLQGIKLIYEAIKQYNLL